MSFADNSSTNSTELFDQFMIHSGYTFLYFILLVTFFSLVLFPFYAYLNIVNRPQDSQRAVFQFLNFFFRIMCFSEFGHMFLLMYFIAIVIIKQCAQHQSFDCIAPFRTAPNFEITEYLPSIFAVFTFLLTFVATLVNLAVSKLLTSFLAFHRFLLYFTPKVGDFLTPGKDATTILICLLYTAVVLLGIVMYRESQTSETSERYITFCIVFGLSELLISIPYTFMILSIRRLTRLASAIQSRPEKYIAYQIVIAFFFKMISLIEFLRGMYSRTAEKKGEPVEMFMVTDIFTFPLSVQLAYVLSNKKNVDTLIAVITGKVMFWKNRARVDVESSTRF